MVIMSTIYYLTLDDIVPNGKNLCVNISGITFVMFYSQKCGHCNKFKPEYHKLVNSFKGVNFGMFCVDDKNSVIVGMSQNTTTPITVVPKFILYYEGIPHVEYNGHKNFQAVASFLNTIISQLKTQSFAKPRRTRQEYDSNINNAVQPPRAQMQPPQQKQPDQNQGYTIAETTGVKLYETSYGRPYNTLNEQEFLAAEKAYLEMAGSHRK